MGNSKSTFFKKGSTGNDFGPMDICTVVNENPRKPRKLYIKTGTTISGDTFEEIKCDGQNRISYGNTSAPPLTFNRLERVVYK